MGNGELMWGACVLKICPFPSLLGCAMLCIMSTGMWLSITECSAVRLNSTAENKLVSAQGCLFVNLTRACSVAAYSLLW